MIRFLFVIIFSYSTVYAGAEEKAIRKTSEALLKTEKIKAVKKNIDRKVKYMIKEYVGEEIAAVTGAAVDIAVSGKIDTSRFNYKYKVLDSGYIEPKIVYDIYSNETSSLLTLDIKY